MLSSSHERARKAVDSRLSAWCSGRIRPGRQYG
jgi:hypothetical protein